MAEEASRFAPDLLDELRAAREVQVVTGGGRHRAIIWVVVDDQDRVLIRSVRGPRGRWHREALADPRIALEVEGRVIPVVAELADDAERVEAASQALRAKYRRSPGSLASMLREVTLPTTLELRPA